MSAHVIEQLSAYMDGELAAAERQAIGAHLRLCAECARHLEDLAAVDELARALPAEAPAGYFDSLPARVRFKTTARPRRALRMPAWSWAAAAAVLLAVIVPLTLEHRPGPPAVATTEGPSAASAPPAASVAPPAPTTEPAKKEAPFGEPQAPARLASGDEAKRNRVDALRDDVKAREQAAFAVAPAPPAAPVAAQAEGPRSEAGPPPAALGKAEGGTARAPAAGAPPSATPGRVAQAVPYATAPEEALLEGPAGQHLREPEEEKDVAEALPPAEEAGKLESPRATGAVGLRDADKARRKARPAVLTFGSLLAEAPSSAEEARRVRERWRAFLLQAPPASEADEARVRLVEVGLKAWQLSNDPADLSLLKRDAEDYLRRDDAAQGDRVRRLLARTGN